MKTINDNLSMDNDNDKLSITDYMKIINESISDMLGNIMLYRNYRVLFLDDLLSNMGNYYYENEFGIKELDIDRLYSVFGADILDAYYLHNDKEADDEISNAMNDIGNDSEPDLIDNYMDKQFGKDDKTEK